MVGPVTLLKLLYYKQRILNNQNKLNKNNCLNIGFAEPCVKEEFRGITVKIECMENEERPQSCRVCLKEGTIPIFGDHTSENISEDLSTMTSIEIDPLDELPKYLCQACHSLLQAALLLRKTAQQSDNILRNANVAETSGLDNNYDDSLNYCVEEKEKNTNNDNMFSCNECNLVFKSFTEYNNHRVTEKHETGKSLCPYCQKLIDATCYMQHLSLHKPEKLFICDICGKKFTSQQPFTRHCLTHSYILPFKCTLCPYRGRFAASLKMHMRSHTGDKPYQCSVCPSRFISKSNLNKHALTHKAEHDFKCETCGRGFYNKRALELHFKVDHTGIKDHICNVCGKAFGYKKQLRKHERKVHKREKLRSGRMPVYLEAAAKNIAIEDC